MNKNKSTRRLAIMTLATTFCLTFAAQADEGVSNGALLASMCNTCHGVDGGGSKSIPALNDLESDELVETMQAFQTGDEDSTIMDRHATGYSEEQLKALADYYTSMQ
ncbi:MAG: c-type cytochrome [Gammaproteobacteria bacterium]|nr:c-type cytochrome [Gammaproteobacteria bacterium]